jgi:hypothetical protein
MDLHSIKFGLGIASCIIGGIAVLFYLYVRILATSNK